MAIHNTLRGIVLLFALMVAPALAAAEQSISWTEYLRFTDAQVHAAGEEGRYLVGVWTMTGLAEFSDGEVAVITATGTLDYDRGLGRYGGWVEYRFEDGSTKLARLEGEVTERLPDGGNLQEGTFTYVAGTGRFDGIEGSGTFSGRQYRPADDGGDSLVRVEGTYSVP